MAHDFSDDDFDDLPLNTLDELESNAIQYTQRQQIVHALSSDYGDDLDNEAFDDATIVDVANKEPIPSVQPSKLVRPAPIANEEPRLSRYVSSNQSQSLSVPSLAFTARIQTEAGGRVAGSHGQNTQTHQNVQLPPTPKTADGGVDGMRKQIEELMKEREQLKQQLTAKTGEIAIVRTNNEKAAKEHERQLNILMRTNAEELLKHKKDIDMARDAERTAATELVFAKRDLAEEGEKIRNLKKAKDKDKPGSDLLSTPKKNKSLSYRDGFDDDEIQFISPSKWQPKKSNPSTPTKAGNKRKRKVVESPAAALDLVQGPDPTQPEQAQTLVSRIDLALLEKLSKDDHRLDFLQSMLNHRPYHDHLRTIEEFGKHFFPSDPNQSFSSIILDKLPTLRAKEATSFCIEFCEIITSLWSKCLLEKYYSPVYLLIDLLTFAIELRTLLTAPFVVDTLLPVIQDTICLLAVPRFKREPPPSFSKEIDMTGCLNLLYLVALGCVGDREHMVRFWRYMRLEFVLMILSNLQTMEDLEIMLPIMSTSALSGSIGPIAADAEAQKKQAEYILDRVTYLLFEKPAVAEGKPPPDRSRLLHLRLQLLSLIDAICRTTYGAEAMTAHPLAIGRLAKLMSDELDVVYDFQAGYRQSAQVVCFSNRLLHHLVTKYERLINMQKKLQPIHGGVHKYLTSLARLAFNDDDLVYGTGFDPEVALCAREMLEALVTPEEGEAIYEAFASP